MRKADLATLDIPKEGHMNEEGLGVSAGESRLKGWQPNKIACFTVGAQLCCMIVIGWTVSNVIYQPLTIQLYIVYSIGT
jgi:hypothetical protein